MFLPILNRAIKHLRTNQSTCLLASVLPALLISACTAENPQLMPLPEPPPTITPPIEETARFLMTRSVRWPGGGRELTVGVVNQATSAPFAEDLSSRFTLAPVDGSTVTSKFQRVTLTPGYTALLLPPSQTAAERATLSLAIQQFVASRPANERIALYRYGSSIQMFSNFLTDRNKINESLVRYQNGVDGDANVPALPQAIGPVVSDTHEIGGSGPDVMRSVVVLTPDPKPVFVDYPQAYVLAVKPDQAGLMDASTAIDVARQSAFYKVSACGVDTKVNAKLRVNKLQGEYDASLPSTLPEEVGAACNVDAIDSAKRSYTPVIEFVFDAAQRTAHDERIRATQSATYNETLARSDFQMQVRLAPGQPTILTTAHLHGQSSLRCERKSYTIQLDGPDRYLLPNSASDEYTLISMCDDPAYVYAPTVYSLLADDLFTSKYRFVEVVIDGTTRGIYMLVEKNREEMVRDHARVKAVMRRQYPSGTNDMFEVLYSDNADLAAPVNRYRSFITEITPLSGDALIASLRNHMDFEQYMRYLANQSVFRSGDYIDELYLHSSEQADGLGGTSETYRFMAWDPEGYTTCHSGGANAYNDPNGMAYCAEARLDFKILPDAKVYRLFVDQIEEALNNRLNRTRMSAALDATRTALQALLSTPAICAAMVELKSFNAGYADCAVARSIIASRATTILSNYDARRTALLPLIATYRAKP